MWSDRGGQTTNPTPINQRSVYAASIRFLTASCKFYMHIIIILTPHTRVAYFPSRNTYADFRMNETFPTTCSKSQIVTLWRSYHNLWKFVNYSVTPWMSFTRYPRPTRSPTLQSVALPFQENVNKHFIQRIHTAATNIVFERLLKQNILLNILTFLFCELTIT